MKISPHIEALKIPFQIPLAPDKVLNRFVYTYIIASKSLTVLIDCGVAGAEQMISERLNQPDQERSTELLMILTHAHPDHIGAAKALKAELDCLVAAHPAARPWVEDIEAQFNDRPVPGFYTLVGGSTAIDRLLDDNEIIGLEDGLSLQVLYTPGHSRCSLSLFCPEDGVLFSGDAIPQKNELPIYDDVSVAVASIRKMRSIKGIKTFLASWSDPQPKADPYRSMDEGLHYLQTIHSAIRQCGDKDIENDPMLLCRKVVTKLNLPEVAVNPLVARAFVSHLPHLDQQHL